MEAFLTMDGLISFFSLAILEIVLGIDNIIFISILTSKLPKAQQNSARTVGLMVAMLTRIMLLCSLTWLMQFTHPLFVLFDNAISGRDIILIAGGMFLLAKSTLEIHTSIEENQHDATNSSAQRAQYLSVILQIAIIDIVFSLDSVITAIGLAKHLEIMIAAIVAAMFVMLFLAKTIAEFIDSHPTLKVLALSFLMLIGLSLVGEGLELHIPKGYIYFAMVYSVVVEIINMRIRKPATNNN